MYLRAETDFKVPKMTGTVTRAVFPKGNAYMVSVAFSIRLALRDRFCNLTMTVSVK